MANVDRTITVPKIGDRVQDREAQGEEDSEAVVLDVHVDTPASQHYIPALGKSVADVNRGYPEDAPVVTVAYVADIDDSIYSWENIPDEELQEVISENGIRQYDFPAPRLDLLAKVPQSTTSEDDVDNKNNSEENSGQGETETGEKDSIGNNGKKFDLSTVPENLPSDGSGDKRYVRKRGEYLKRVSSLRENICEALAWREIGYSKSGIAKKMDTTESTVKSWMEEVEEEYGKDALETRPQSNPVPELE